MARTSKDPPPRRAGLEPPRSNTAGDAPDNELQPDLTGDSAAATASHKRGRGRPPKAKSDSQPTSAVSAHPTRKPSTRPKRNVVTAATAIPTASAAAVVKSGRGRPRRSNTLAATESLGTTVNGSRKRGRPKKDDVAAARRTVGRPKKVTEATIGQGAADPRELKKKATLLQKKVKIAADKLKIAVSAIEELQELAAGM